jgi:hypothetical protein
MAIYNFPKGIGSKIATNAQPFMLLTSYESKNAIESTGHTGYSNNNTNPDYEPGIAKSSIALYIPPNALQTKFNSTYDATPGAATRAAMGEAYKGASDNMLDTLWAGLKGAGISLGERVAKQVDKGTGMLAAQGIAVNNHLALTYKGPTQFRSHSFAFKFFPKNVDDADEIQRILLDLENGMLPRAGQVAGGAVTKISGRSLSAPFFQSPRHWGIDFFNGNGTRNDYLFRIRKSVITEMTVNHDPNSTVSLHENTGSPVQTDLTLSFQEIELPISRDKGLVIEEKPKGPARQITSGGSPLSAANRFKAK